VVAWFTPSDKGVKIFVQNFSGEPVFNYGVIVQPKPTREVDRMIAANPARPIPIENLPPPNHVSKEFALGMLHRYGENDDLDFVLPPGETNSRDNTLDYSPRAYDFYVFFSDAYGRRWVRDARTNRLLPRRAARHIHPAESKLKAIFDQL